MRTLSYLRTMPGTRRFLAGVFSCFISGLLLAFLLPSLAFAASPGGYTFGQSQALDQASVSVVRLAMTYSPSAQGCPTSGLGIIVSSSLPAASTSYRNLVLTDAALLNPGPTCGKLAALQIYASSAYNKQASGYMLASLTCTTRQATIQCGSNEAPAETVICQHSSCTGGAALLPFTATAATDPLPFPALSTSSQPLVPTLGIGLTTNTAASTTPVPFVAATASPVDALTPTAINGSSGEAGMPIVDEKGQLVGMEIAQTPDTVDIVQFVQNSLPAGSQTNPVQQAWDQAVSDFYRTPQGNVGNDLQPIINRYQDFQAPIALERLAAVRTSRSTPTASSSPATTQTTTSANQAGPLGLPISQSLLFVGIVVVVILVLALLVIGFVVWKRRASAHRQYEEEMHRAEKVATLEAQRIRQEEQAQAQAQAQAQPGARAQQGWEQWQQQKDRANAPPIPAPPPASGQPPVPAPPSAPMQPQSPVPATPLAPVYQQSPSLRCPNCSAPINPGDNFCSQCRAALLPSDSGLHLRSVNPPAPTPSAGIADATTVQMSPDQMQTVLGQIPAGMDAERTQPFPKQPLVSAPRHGRFVVATRSDRGYKRKYKPNEDSLFAAVGAQSPTSPFQDLGIFVVADGMGGHANGKDASNLAIQTIQERIVPELQSGATLRDEDYIRLLKDGVQSANLAVHQRNVDQRADMGTTMTAALIVDKIAYVANVGDSRTYLYRQSEGLKKITNDHSVVASLVTAGIINAEDVYTHPKRNQIYRSLGEKPDVEVDVFSVPLQPGDILLLCCDGLWEMTRDNIIQEILLKMPDPAQAGQALIEAALHGGGDDNISVVLAKVDGASPASGTRDFEVLATPDKPQYPPLPNGSDD